MGAALPLHITCEPSLAATLDHWVSLCAEPAFAALPYRKVETKANGDVLLMSPARSRHSVLQSRIAKLLEREADLHSIEGAALAECPVLTRDGVKVPDVAWAGADQVRRNLEQPAFLDAPLVCIEVLSPSNTSREMIDKAALYFAAGAREVWLCADDGVMRFIGPHGDRAGSAVFPGFPAKVTVVT